MRQGADRRPRVGKEAAQRIVQAQSALVGQAQDGAAVKCLVTDAIGYEVSGVAGTPASRSAKP